MLALPSPFQEALDASTAYELAVTVTASRGAASVVVEPASGQLTQDSRRSMRWDGQLIIPVSTELLPTTPAALLTPFGTLVTVRLGIKLADGQTADVPYGTYMTDASKIVLTPNGRAVDMTLIDLADRLAEYRFETPFVVPPGTDLADAINQVVTDRLGVSPNLALTGITLARARIFGLEADTDPWRELVELAQGFGYRIWYDRTGTLILDQSPIPDPNTAFPLLGELTVAGSFDARPPNVVVVRGETSDDTPPVQAVAYDDDTSSPTYAGATPGSSPYGRVTRYLASPLITNQAEADLAAQNILAGIAGAGATWTASRPYDPTLDADDVLLVPLTETESLPLVVDAATVTIGGTTDLECRALSQLI